MTIQINAFSIAAFEKTIIPVNYIKEKILDGTICKNYLIFTGINTGYGFYGVNVATNKFFIIEAKNKNGTIQKFELNKFNSKSTFSRFGTICSWIYNFNVETEDMLKKLKKENKLIQLRKKYLERVYQKIGKYAVKDIPSCDSYTIKLATVVPPNIWKNKLEKNNVYVLQKFNFKNQ